MFEHLFPRCWWFVKAVEALGGRAFFGESGPLHQEGLKLSSQLHFSPSAPSCGCGCGYLLHDFVVMPFLA